MSEEQLRQLVERLNSDESFRERLNNDPQGAIEEFDLSPAEHAALVSQDEDALRRLLGEDVSGFAVGQAGLFSTLMLCQTDRILCYTRHGSGCGNATKAHCQPTESGPGGGCPDPDLVAR
jgi:hypothetical protein